MLDADMIVNAAKEGASYGMAVNDYLAAYLEAALREAVRQVNEKVLQSPQTDDT